MQPFRALAAPELTAAAHHIQPVVDVDPQQFPQAEHPGLPVDQGDVVDAERFLHRREPVQLVEQGLGVEPAPDLDHQVQAAVPVGEVLEVSDPG